MNAPPARWDVTVLAVVAIVGGFIVGGRLGWAVAVDSLAGALLLDGALGIQAPPDE